MTTHPSFRAGRFRHTGVCLALGLLLIPAPALAQRPTAVPHEFGSLKVPRSESGTRTRGNGVGKAFEGRPEPPVFHPKSPELSRKFEPIRWKERESPRWRETIRGIVVIRSKTGPIAGVEPAPFHPEIITALPASPEAYRNVFGRNGGPDEWRLMSEEIGLLDRNLGAKNLGGEHDDSARLWVMMAAAAERKQTGVVVMGHSVRASDGSRSLVLPNGDPVPFGEIVRKADELGLICRILSCYSKDFGIAQPLGLKDARHLLEQVTQSFVVPVGDPPLPVKVESPGSTRSGGRSYRGVPVQQWDNQFASVRGETELSRVVVVGTTPDLAGRLHVWESILSRPFWLGLGAWSLLGAGLIAAVAAMLQARRQTLRPSRSMDEWTEAVGGRFRRSQGTRRATARALGLSLVVSLGLAAAVVPGECRYATATGEDPLQSVAILSPSYLGFVLLLVAAVIPRLDPQDSLAGRTFHGLGGLVAGAVLAFVLSFAVIGAFALALGLWINALHAIACLYNGFARLPGQLRDSGHLALIVCGLFSSPVALLGLIRGGQAGWFGFPLLPALRYGPDRYLSKSVPYAQSPASVTCCSLIEIANTIALATERGLWTLLNLVLFLTMPMSFLMMVFFSLDLGGVPDFPDRFVLIALMTVVLCCIGLLLSPAMILVLCSIGFSVGLGRSFGMSQSASQSKDTIDPLELACMIRIPLRMSVLMLFMFIIFSLSYVKVNIDGTPFSVNSKVRLVRAPNESKHAVSPKFSPILVTAPLIYVYQVPSQLCLNIEMAYPDANKNASDELIKRLSEQVVANRRVSGKTRENPLIGPNGVVFVRSPTPDLAFADGEVFDGSQAVVLADDQGGRSERDVLIRLVRDPSLEKEIGEPDPGAVAVVRAANLKAAFP